MKSKNKIISPIKGCPPIVWLILFFAVYYGILFFTLIPNSDEVGFYLKYSRESLLYGITQWDAPGNHVFYIFLSSILDKITGNILIGTRGISCLFALINIALVLKIGGKYLFAGDKEAVYFACLYGVSHGIAEYAVRGRGYTLCMTFFLTAIICMLGITEPEGENRARYYIGLGGSFLLGLYTIPTYLYCMLPIVLYLIGSCIRDKDAKRFWKLILCAVVTAAAVFAVYMPIFICLGVPVKYPLEFEDRYRAYFGYKTLSLFVKAPLETLILGIKEYLKRSSQYTGSIPFENVVRGLAGEMIDIFRFLSYGLTGIFALLTLIVSVVGIVIARRKKTHVAILL